MEPNLLKIFATTKIKNLILRFFYFLNTNISNFLKHKVPLTFKVSVSDTITSFRKRRIYSNEQ